ERAAILTRVAEIYSERAEELAEVIRLEMGKAVPEGKGEVGLCSRIYKYFADNAEAFMADEPLRGPKDATAMIRRKPVGSLLGIMPWNFPYYQVARFAAPNLALATRSCSSTPRSARARPGSWKRSSSRRACPKAPTSTSTPATSRSPTSSCPIRATTVCP